MTPSVRIHMPPSYAGEPRPDGKTPQKVGDEPIPLEPLAASAPTGQTPSGRNVAVCVFSKSDDYATACERGDTFAWIAKLGLCLGIGGGIVGGVAPHESRAARDGAIAGGVLGPIAFALALPPMVWSILDARDLRSRTVEAIHQASQKTPKKRLEDHVKDANASRKTYEGIAKSISFLKSLRSDHPNEIEESLVTRSIANLIKGAASIRSESDVAQLTSELIARVKSGLAEPRLVVDCFAWMANQAFTQLKESESLSHEGRWRIHGRCDGQLAQATVETVALAVRAQPPAVQAAVKKGWDLLSENGASMKDIASFARGVVNAVATMGGDDSDGEAIIGRIHELVGKIPFATQQCSLLQLNLARAAVEKTTSIATHYSEAQSDLDKAWTTLRNKGASAEAIDEFAIGLRIIDKAAAKTLLRFPYSGMSDDIRRHVLALVEKCRHIKPSNELPAAAAAPRRATQAAGESARNAAEGVRRAVAEQLAAATIEGAQAV